jgi:hypothetical protein
MGLNWARYLRGVIPATLGAAALAALCLPAVHAQGSKQPAAKKQDPVEAQRAIEGAAKLLKSGKAEQAVQALSATMAHGNLPPAILAKALYVRGLAFREQKKVAHAISDLNSALWLKGGLGGDERADATKQRLEAYADAGLTERGQALVPASADSAGSRKKSGGNWLSSLFGSPDAAPPPPSPPPPPRKEKVDPPPVAKVEAIGGWSSKTEVKVDRAVIAPPPAAKPPAEPPPRAKEPPPAKEPPSPARAEGRFHVRLAPVRTKAEASALAAKAKRELGSEPSIDQSVLGNMGSFYLVHFGPFASARESQAVCTKLQGSGLECMAVTR